MKCFLCLVLAGAGIFSSPAAETNSVRAVIPAIPEGRLVDTNTLQRIYDEVKTPFKYGVVLTGGGTNELVDCPSVFRSDGHWFMMYVAISNKVGYQTFLARSDDLLHWEKLGKILSFTTTNDWDAWQEDGGIALADYRWDGSHELEKFDGKFWLSYIGGAKKGYETDPLSTGVAWTESPAEIKNGTVCRKIRSCRRNNPTSASSSTRRSTKAPSSTTHPNRSAGRLILFYNGKYKNGYERIGMAVSRDMVHWNRYGDNPVVANGEAKTNGISGDPQIVKMGDVWVMFYFGAGWKPRAFDTFACSYDLVHWTKWSGANLIQPSEPWDKTYAHKPWILKWNGVVYHFYCAVGDQGRVIALATSKDLKSETAR